MNCTKKALTGILSVLALVCGAQAANVSVKAMCQPLSGVAGCYELLTNVTFHASNTYLLDGVIAVDDGAVLTIEAGTVLRGYNENTTGVTYRPGMLIVRPGGKLYANGTVSSPIIFTDEWDNNVPGMTAGPVLRTWGYRNGSPSYSVLTDTYDYSKVGGLHGVWGGVVLCGKAFVNWDNMTLGNAQVSVEGLDVAVGATGGGRDDDDSCGVVKYVQIRYGGSILTSNKEINGFTMYGVGRGTELHHIEVFNNQDDCFEWFGGTVCAKYLVAWGAGDDTFDSDCGFRGKNQFLFGVQRNLGGSKRESGCSDKGMEMDGFETGTASGQYLWSASAWYNITLVGWGEQDPGSGKQKNVAIQMRDNASPQINNSVFMDFGTYASFIENRTDYGAGLNATDHFTTTNGLAAMPSVTTTDVNGDTVGAAYFYQAQRPGMQAHIKDCIFWDIPSLYPTQTGSALNTLFGSTSTAGSGPYFTGSLGAYNGWTGAANNNVTDIYDDSDPASGFMPIMARTRVAVTNRAPYASSVVGYDVTYIDPRAAADAVHAAHAVASDGWLSPAAYRGAFDPYSNWARGWTTVDRLGVFGVQQAVTESESSVTVTDFTIASPIAYFNTEAGLTYRVKASTTVNGTYTTIAEVAGTGNPVSFLDLGATDASKFYKVVVVTVQN